MGRATARLVEHLATWVRWPFAVTKLLTRLRDLFWAMPAAMVFGAALLAIALISIDRSGLLPEVIRDSVWLYHGSPDGARSLLGMVAASMLGVAGTVFSITIAALSLAAGQMGPRLLQNFTRDRGNQFTLGAFLGTFVFALLVMRSVDSRDTSVFVPQLSLAVAIVMTFVCVATLVYFVGHMASRINVDTVVELVGDDFYLAVQRLMQAEAAPAAIDDVDWRLSTEVRHSASGYLQHLDTDLLATFASEHGSALKLLVRPGDFVFPGAPVALMCPAVEGAERTLSQALALGALRGSLDDLEDAIKRLVEVAVRALSPGINDPNTAVSVLDRLGAGLCQMAGLHLPPAERCREGRLVLLLRAHDYAGVLDAMFHAIRQCAESHPAVLIRLLAVLSAVSSCEPLALRRRELLRHAGLVLADAERAVRNSADLEDVRSSHLRFVEVLEQGLVATEAGALSRRGRP